MTNKKAAAPDKWMGARDAAQVLSDKHKRPIPPKYVRRLSQRKNQPVRSKVVGDRVLYHRDDIGAATIKQRVATDANPDERA